MADKKGKLAPSSIGGQAVLEGIMMRCKDDYAVAVRKPDGEIEVDVHRGYKGIGKGKKFTKLPFIRGVFAFVDSMVLGIKTLTYSASFYEDEEEKKKEDKKEQDGKWDSLLMGLTVLFSVALSIGLFMVLPYFLSDFLLYQKLGWIGKGAVPVLEGIVKLILFILYIWAVSFMQDIKRTYRYHGAEHKCINCLESGKTLTVEHVRESSRFHKRCGTSFLFLVMIISIAFFMAIRSDHIWLQYVLRILLVPLIAGVSYELIKFAGSRDNWLVDVISAPGKLLQRLTTSEPDDSMIEVAIRSVEAIYDWRTYLKENGVQVEETEHEEV